MLEQFRTPQHLFQRMSIRRQAPITRRAKLIWTLGNLLMLLGLIVLLYVGGIYVSAEFHREAARGDSDIPVSAAVIDVSTPQAPAPFIAPMLNAITGESASEQFTLSSGALAPQPSAVAQPSTITRIAIPALDVDSKVIEVGWEIVPQKDGSELATWQVAKFAVGHHQGSANPGAGDNIVLAGHVGGYGKVFKDLYNIEVGDQIVVYSQGQQYLYIVDQRLLVVEEGVSAEQQAENAQLIAPTSKEIVTLVTCWPPSGPDKFKKRIIVQASPFTSTVSDNHVSNWTIR
jgi:LPXTG-site transpeptidase (sortase) family protein